MIYLSKFEMMRNNDRAISLRITGARINRLKNVLVYPDGSLSNRYDLLAMKRHA